MNGEDPQNHHRGYFRGQYHNKRHNSNRDTQWYDGSWISNQSRKPFPPRGGRPKPSSHYNSYNNKRKGYISSHERPPHRREPRPVSPPSGKAGSSPPPKSSSPFPGTEEYFQKNVQLKSGSLLKQMEESPDAELVLPRNHSESVVDDNNENILPGMRYIKEVAEINSAELNHSRRKEKRAAQLATDPEVIDLVKRIRLLQRQERVKVRRELEKVYNKTLNLQDCKTINTILPDLTVKIEDMPDEFMSIFSDACTIDVDAATFGNADANVAYGVTDASIADGDQPYNPFENDFDSVDYNNVPEPQRLPTYNDHSQYMNNTMADQSSHHSHDGSLYGDSVDMEDTPPVEYERKIVLKCNVKAGRAESRGKSKFKLRRAAIDLTGEDSRSSFPTPPPPTAKVQNSSDYLQVPPPPPRISDCCWRIDVTPDDPKETYNNHEPEEPVEQCRSLIKNDLTSPYKSDVNANGLPRKIYDEIEFCSKFDMGDDHDEWNRKIIVKSNKRVRRELVAEYMGPKEEDKVDFPSESNEKRETHVQNGQILDKSDTTRLVVEEQEEELNYEVDSDADVEMAEEEESQPSDNCEVFQGVEVEDTSQDASEIENASAIDEIVEDVPEEPVSKEQNAPAIIVVDPTSQPGRLVLNRGKLVNVQMICATPASAEETVIKESDEVAVCKPDEAVVDNSIGINTSEQTESDCCDNNKSSIEAPAKKRKLSVTADVVVTPPVKETTSTQDQAVQTSCTKQSLRGSRDDVKRTNRRVQTDPDKTTLGKLLYKYKRYKRKTRQAMRKLHVIDKRLEEMFAERKQIVKSLEALTSTSESEEEPAQTEKQKQDKKKPAKYIYISVDGSTPSKRNPILSSDSPSEQVLTQVLPTESETNPDSPSNLGQTLENMDLFSLISENKASFAEAAGPADMEIRDETFTETSNTMPESEAAECENTDELGGMMNIAETVPADILESSDNEYLGESPPKNPFVKLIKYNAEDLHRMRNEYVSKSMDDQVHQTNNNFKDDSFKVDVADMESTDNFMETEVYDDEEMSDEIIDYVGWRDTIVVITIIKKLIVAGNEKGKIFYYDTQTNYPIYSETLTTLPITSIVAQEVRKETRLFIGSMDSQLVTYDVQGRKEVNKIVISAPIQCMEMAWSKLYIGTSRGDILKCTLPKTKVTLSVNIMQQAVLAIRCGMEGSRRIVVVAMRNGPIYIRDANTFLQLRTLGNAICATVYSLVLHNNRVYCGTSQEDVLAFNFHDGRLMFKFSESKGSGIVCMTTVKNLLFVASYNGNIYVYNTTDNSYITSILAPAGMLLSMAVVNKRLIAGTKQNFQCLPLPACIRRLL